MAMGAAAAVVVVLLVLYFLLARRLVGGTGADRAHARVTYRKETGVWAAGGAAGPRNGAPRRSPRRRA